eukprot:4886924-Amphidinium_carterae.2
MLSPNTVCTNEDVEILILSTVQLGYKKHQLSQSTSCLLSRYSTDIYDTMTGRLPTRETGRGLTTRTSLHSERKSTEKIMPENQKLYRRNQEQKLLRSTKQSGLAETLLQPKEEQIDKTLLLKVTSIEGEYDNSRKKTDKGKQPIPPRLYDSKSPALPYTRSKTTTTPDWHFKPPDQPILDAPPRVPTFPTFTKNLKEDCDYSSTSGPPPPGLQQPLGNMHLQEWYDDDNEDYDANEPKTAIKEEHDTAGATPRAPTTPPT